jgi:hypothetical protein
MAPISEIMVLIGRGRWIAEIRTGKALAVPNSLGFAVLDDAARLHRRVLWHSPVGSEGCPDGLLALGGHTGASRAG